MKVCKIWILPTRLILLWKTEHFNNIIEVVCVLVVVTVYPTATPTPAGYEYVIATGSMTTLVILLLCGIGILAFLGSHYAYSLITTYYVLLTTYYLLYYTLLTGTKSMIPGPSGSGKENRTGWIGILGIL